MNNTEEKIRVARRDFDFSVMDIAENVLPEGSFYTSRTNENLLVKYFYSNKSKTETLYLSYESAKDSIVKEIEKLKGLK